MRSASGLVTCAMTAFAPATPTTWNKLSSVRLVSQRPRYSAAAAAWTSITLSAPGTQWAQTRAVTYSPSTTSISQQSLR